MNQQKVNGWTNYETWNFMLWYGDNLHDVVTEYYNDNEDFEPNYDEVFGLVQDYINEVLYEGHGHYGFLGDIIGHAINSIDLDQITKNILEDL